MPDKQQKLEAQLEEVTTRLEQLRKRMREDRSWEKEDFAEMFLEVFDDIGSRLDRLLSKF